MNAPERKPPERLYRADWLPDNNMAHANIWSGPSSAYILATPEALAAAPEVQRLIAEAVAREREACAKIVEPLSTGEQVWRATKADGQPKLRFEVFEVRQELKWLSRAFAAAIRNRKETT